MTLAEQLNEYNRQYQAMGSYVSSAEMGKFNTLQDEIEAQGFYLIRIYTDRVPPQISGDYSGEDMIDLFVLRAK